MELEDRLSALNFTTIVDNIRSAMIFEELASGSSSPDRAQKLLHFAGVLLVRAEITLMRIS